MSTSFFIAALPGGGSIPALTRCLTQEERGLFAKQIVPERGA